MDDSPFAVSNAEVLLTDSDDELKVPFLFKIIRVKLMMMTSAQVVSQRFMSFTTIIFECTLPNGKTILTINKGSRESLLSRLNLL